MFCYVFLLVCGVCSDWEKVEEDCRKAIQLDSNLVKVFVFFCSSFCLTCFIRYLASMASLFKYLEFPI